MAKAVLNVNTKKDKGLKAVEKVLKQSKKGDIPIIGFNKISKFDNKTYLYISNGHWAIGFEIKEIDNLKENQIDIKSIKFEYPDTIVFEYDDRITPDLDSIVSTLQNPKHNLKINTAKIKEPTFSKYYSLLIQHLLPKYTLFIKYYELVNNVFLDNEWHEILAFVYDKKSPVLFTNCTDSIFAVVMPLEIN